MARYDEDTLSFMRKVAGSEEEPSGSSFSLPRQAAAVAKALLSENPREALGKVVVRKGIKVLADKGFENPADKVASAQDVNIILNMARSLTGVFGDGWWDWEPETIEATAKERNLPYNDVTENSIGALQVCLNTNQPFENWHVFEKVAIAFNGSHVDFAVLQPLRTDEAAGTISALRALRPKETFDSEVVTYVACCAKHDGLVYLPDAWFGPEFQAALDSLGNDMVLKARTESVWKEHKRDLCQNDAERVQFDSLVEIEDYLKKVGG